MPPALLDLKRNLLIREQGNERDLRLLYRS